jgi:hypothetical protein
MWPWIDELGMEWLALIGPLERLGHSAVEVVDEAEDLLLQVIDGAEIAAP